MSYNHEVCTADVLEARFEEIYAAYEQQLSAIESPLVADGASRAQLKAQALCAITDAASDLRGHEGPLSGVSGREQDEISTVIGASRARESVHPMESLRAVTALYEAALSTLVDDTRCSRGSSREVASVALALQKSIMKRVTRASAAYGYYLLRKLHDSQADERRRISRELHDRVAHSIMVAFRNLELYELYRTQDPTRAQTKLDLAKSTAQEALRCARNLSSDLRISSADEGLETALSDYLRSVVSPHVRVRVSSEGDEALIPTEIRDQIFLVLREAIRNTLAHADARKIGIEYSITTERFEASVEDDGRGFEPAGTSFRSGGTGMMSMTERASLLRGALSVDSSPGGGTRIRLSIPLPGEGS